MTVTVPELVPEASLLTQRAVFFLPESFRGQTELGQEGKCFIPKSVRCCTHIVQKLCLWHAVD